MTITATDPQPGHVGVLRATLWQRRHTHVISPPGNRGTGVDSVFIALEARGLHYRQCTPSPKRRCLPSLYGSSGRENLSAERYVRQFRR